MDYTLAPWRRAFVSDLARCADNPSVAENLRDGFPQPYTTADAEAYVSDCMDKGEEAQLCRAILVDGRAAGSIGIFLRENGGAELGYWLAEPCWGLGIMTGAASALCAEAFHRFPITHIFATPYAHNAGSRRVLEKSGFAYGGLTECSGCSRGRVCLYTLKREAAPGLTQS